MSTFIPADLVVDQARLRMQTCLQDARIAADLLRAGRIDWLTAHHLVGAQQTMVNTTSWTLEAVLDAAGVADALGKVIDLRDTTQAALQALQDVLRERHLFDSPAARRDA
ncbi:hypothetical protein C667_02923 [Thauera phenylacetica B4P]|uniref:Uncharacterized protein n=1 Tax=Thauera phenylacetica B4P TaxID=1234382 RepID=N6ZW83_9RHOO|nr:hypothetical protein [Thauera phenylacetica]ENO98623.1 hypothetical protein C667_02923 [Thauera phenylacetica B4P]